MPKKHPDGASDESNRVPDSNNEELLDSVLDEVLGMSGQTLGKMRQALNVRTDILTDVAAAPRLAERHHVHVRTQEVARLMYLVCFGQPEEKEQARQALVHMRKDAVEQGIFLFEQDQQFQEHRLSSCYPDGQREYLIIETSASHAQRNHPRHGIVAPAADAQFHLPSLDRDAPAVFTIPNLNAGDHEVNHEHFENVQARPHVVMQVDDIATDPQMMNLRLAAHALERGLKHVVEDVNPQRDTVDKIEFVTAEIVCVTGMEIEGGHVLYFGGEIDGTPIWNKRSFQVFGSFESKYCTHFDTGWVLKNRKVPVQGHPVVRNIIADWHVQVATLRKP